MKMQISYRHPAHAFERTDSQLCFVHLAIWEGRVDAYIALQFPAFCCPLTNQPSAQLPKNRIGAAAPDLTFPTSTTMSGMNLVGL